MSLLVEYSLKEGRAEEQAEALRTFVDGLKALGDQGFHYSAFETDDPTRFIGLLEFDTEDAKQAFIKSAPFAEYRDNAQDRFSASPNATQIRLVASTRR
ncbi:MAG: antibiotic biosynthesis monooxygenase [Pseudomonadota bacterium]